MLHSVKLTSSFRVLDWLLHDGFNSLVRFDSILSGCQCLSKEVNVLCSLFLLAWWLVWLGIHRHMHSPQHFISCFDVFHSGHVVVMKHDSYPLSKHHSNWSSLKCLSYAVSPMSLHCFFFMLNSKQWLIYNKLLELFLRLVLWKQIENNFFLLVLPVLPVRHRLLVGKHCT